MASYSDTDRDPRTIEQEIDRDRARVSETIDALQSKLSPNNIMDEVVKAMSAHSGEIAGGLKRAVRNNPLPLVLTGIGLAWLMASSGDKSASSGSVYIDRSTGSSGGVGLGGGGMGGGMHVGERVSETAGGAMSGLRSTVSGARDATGHAMGVASDVASGAASTISGAASTIAGAASGAAGTIADAASGAAGTLSDGLGAGLSQVKAAAGWGSSQGRHLRQGMGSLAEEQPLVLGALALALGAALGGALPRTRTEDELLGAEADRFKTAAMNTIETEGRKVAAVAGAVAKEATQVAEEAGNKLAQAAGGLADHARDVSTRLHDAALQESDSQQGDMIEGVPAMPRETGLAEPFDDLDKGLDGGFVGEPDLLDPTLDPLDPRRRL